MAGGALLYIITSVIGVSAYKFHFLGLNFASMVEIVIYLGTFLLTIPVALRNIYLSYTEGTGKMRSFTEANRPLVSLFIQMILCWVWTLVSNNEVLQLDPRCFYYMSGTLYANIVARLIVAQMSGTRCECFSPGLLPLAAAMAICIVIPGLPAAGELAILYLLTAVLTMFHLHYVVCVLIQMCQHLNITFFKIKVKDGLENQRTTNNSITSNGIASRGARKEDDQVRLLSNRGDLASLLSSDNSDDDGDEIINFNNKICSSSPILSSSSTTHHIQTLDEHQSEVVIASGSYPHVRDQPLNNLTGNTPVTNKSSSPSHSSLSAKTGSGSGTINV